MDPTPKKTNLIFILTDQQRADTIAAWGHPWMITPHQDRLAAGGLNFRRAYCPGATCVASRAALFTGMFAHNTGAYTFHNWGHHRTWIQDLADQGYWCVNIGKMHFQPRDVPGGFHERVIVENPTSVSTWGGLGDDAWGKYLAFHGRTRPNHRHRTEPGWRERFQGVPWTDEEHLHSDAFTARSAISWIETCDTDQPLFLQIGFPGPHEPWDPPQRWIDAYHNRIGLFPEPVRSSLSDRPPQYAATRAFHAGCDHESRIDMPNATPEDLRRMQLHYYAKISYVDEQIGRVLDALEKKGLLDNAIVVLTSDHGDMLGDHGSAYKWLMPESVVRVPLILWSKSHLQPGTVHDLVSLIDLGPTLLESAGVPLSSRLEGVPLNGYFQGATGARKGPVFCEDNYQLMMRTETHKIVKFFGQAAGELYDLSADPRETRNLWDDPASRELRTGLELRMFEWLGRSCYLNGGHKSDPDSISYAMRLPEHDASLHGANTIPVQAGSRLASSYS